MKEILIDDMDKVSGGMKLSGLRSSTNVQDARGVNMGSYIDANGRCWALGTSSYNMYPGGRGVPIWEEKHLTEDEWNKLK